MSPAIDPVTLALTGHLPFHLVVAAVLTWPVSLVLLRRYSRAVRRSMRAQAHGASRAAPAATLEAPAMAASTRGAATLHDCSGAPATPAAEALLAQLMGRPWRAAAVYAVAGSAYGVTMALSQLRADGLEILPVRFLFLFWMFVWPVVPTVAIVAATTWRAKVALTAGYFAGLAVLGAIELPMSPDLTWSQVVLSWVLYDLPPTILMVTFLSRRIRAVGPLVLIFTLLALIGSDVAVSVVGSRDSYLRGVIRLTDAIGLGAVSTFAVVLLTGFLIFAVLGWASLLWIRRRYQAKAMSDESVTVDAIWLLFAVAHSTNLVFGHPLWVLAAVVAFALYKACVLAAFSRLSHRDASSSNPPVLLVLRSFSIGRDSERLFDVLERRWRRVGSTQMIAGIDLVSRTVEPHEFLDFVSGRLARRFIDGEDSLNQRMSERDMTRDRDLRFRVNEFFCYDDTWKMVLSRLVHSSDAVLMDLRGFSRQNAGCVFELHELASHVPLERVVFLVDRRTDETLLCETLGDGRAGVIRFASITGDSMRQLMRAIAEAVHVTSTVRV